MLAPFTPEHDAFRTSVRTFCEKELAPYSREWDEAGIFPRSLFKRFAEMGYFGLHYPERMGGSGLDFWYSAAYIEGLAYARNAGLAMNMLVQSDMATPVIANIGTEEQIQEFLIPAIQGDKIAALGITEPDCGSDVANITTTARKDGSDYIINGAKTFITNGTRADFITLAVRTGGPGYEGISLVLFPTNTKGFQVSQALKKVGNWASDTALLYFEECRIPQRYLLGEENQGFYHIMTNFQGERLVGALCGVAAMQLCWDDAVAYAQERKAFGKPVIKFQVWRHRFVNMLTRIEAARQLTYLAVDAFNKTENAVREISTAKLYACDLAQEVTYLCMQAYGGAGYMQDYDIGRAYRDMRLLTIGGGSSEIMHEIIAKMIGL